LTPGAEPPAASAVPQPWEDFVPEPVKFVIAPHGGLWTLTRDGEHVADYSHVDRATHEAVHLARALEKTGEPAEVTVEAAEGKRISIEVAPTPEHPDVTGQA
jgi:hypothetical protein